MSRWLRRWTAGRGRVSRNTFRQPRRDVELLKTRIASSPASMPSGWQQPLTRSSWPRFCLVHLKIARDVPRLLEFAILVWTIPAPVVQIHIAIPATDASGRVERLHHSANSLKRGPPAFILNLNFPACPCGQFPAVW